MSKTYITAMSAMSGLRMSTKIRRAAKAGLKKGDRLVRLYGVDIPVEGKVFEKINDLMVRHSKDGLPVDVEVERNGRLLSFSIQPDMICPYKIL